MKTNIIRNHKRLIDEATKVYEENQEEFSWLGSTIIDEKRDFLNGFPEIAFIDQSEKDKKIKDIYSEYIEKTSTKDLLEIKNQVK